MLYQIHPFVFLVTALGELKHHDYSWSILLLVFQVVVLWCLHLSILCLCLVNLIVYPAAEQEPAESKFERSQARLTLRHVT